jgi:hypothetical protein
LDEANGTSLRNATEEAIDRAQRTARSHLLKINRYAADDMRGAGIERCYDFARGKSSEGENPTSASGMKQGRREQEGVSRQEVEKA